MKKYPRDNSVKMKRWFAWHPIRVMQQMSDPYIKGEDLSLDCWIWLRPVYRCKVYSGSAPFGKYIYCLCGHHVDTDIDELNSGIHCLSPVRMNRFEARQYIKDPINNGGRWGDGWAFTKKLIVTKEN